MVRIAVVHHERDSSVGRLGPHLAQHQTIDVPAWEGAFPAEVDAAIITGGVMGAYDTADHPWLAEEKRWIAGLVEADLPVLGICLGCQLLADSLGGRAYLADLPEVGVIGIHYTTAGANHPIVSLLGERALFVHQDTFELPPGATLLASTAAYPAAFELGSALALQPHPETPAVEAESWADAEDFHLLERAGLPREEYSAQLAAHEDYADAVAEELFGAWFSKL